MTRVRPLPYDEHMIRDLDDFVPHDLGQFDTPAPASDDSCTPEVLFCLAFDQRYEPLPPRLRMPAELLYRAEEAVLARFGTLYRALCCGTAARPFSDITVPDTLDYTLFSYSLRWSQPLFQSLSQACALAESIPQRPGTAPRLILLTDLPPDHLPRSLFGLVLDRLTRARPGLRAALLYCGTEQTVWTARLGEMQGAVQPILPHDYGSMYDFLFSGGASCNFPSI